MNAFAKMNCNAAISLIQAGRYQDAVDQLRRALKGTSDRKAWSKIMLAIRELSRIVPDYEAIAARAIDTALRQSQ